MQRNPTTAHFEMLFGLQPKDIQPQVLLLPFLPKGILEALGIEKLTKGKLYSSTQTKTLTVIKTGIGAGFVGDAVLHLKETSCQNIFFFGACGALGGQQIKLGSLLLPQECLGMESFSQILDISFTEPPVSVPDAELTKNFLNWPGRPDSLKAVKAATFASLYLEPTFVPYFQKMKVSCLDMECSAFLKAAKHINRKALALFFVTDIVAEKPLFSKLSTDEHKSIQKGMDSGIKTILKFSQSQMTK